MSMPISSPRLLLPLMALALSACTDGEAAPPQGYAEGDVIACKSADDADFARQCGVERAVVDGALFLTVRHPDGHFRRFEVQTDGSGVTTADGFEQAEQALSGDTLEVTVGGDAYRFPATGLSGNEVAGE
ncbi:hypothetical protein [Paraurantiacibacter namhicola]|uniref:Lipoprotein n=1 Tax=Paraurantiacibacter namhicola TaxID=645517 RepID=A0A1C7D9M4_9SPHN|nr:hypothetical protein [Paraurantiacibacter namhicola]ANU08148.1 hypothetical protein A6F65_01853 [Paraurantiacibacter namhicola]